MHSLKIVATTGPLWLLFSIASLLSGFTTTHRDLFPSYFPLYFILFINAEVDLRDTIHFAIVNILLLWQVFACSVKQCNKVSSSL